MTSTLFPRSLVAAGALATATVFGAGVALAGGSGYGTAASGAQVASAASSMDIVDRAVDAKAFTTLVAAVSEAGLVETLKGEGPFTVFAPNDAAFAKLPAGTVEDLLKPENRETLTTILTYHVVPGKVTSGDIAGQALEADTVAGIPLSIDATGSGVMVGGATVTTADVMASNGVIHVIDTVLLPN
ncbi:fasciclin domain-containing protein [Roseospira navarrensis]|uniref:Fasciclin domain-containing protein n=1 Tax=Roseospira navarrensis TaxID=140058 RepID=A0A7X1ZCQ5_9PROT|nr:fasciclin domain-containing protein [Roseospira navarrensis]MQX35928.1 fasciclin domain-containing protein [Roseospira navarrensis]